MATPLVAPDVCRYAINATYLGRPVVNILDMVILDTVGPTGRHEAIERVANLLLNVWSEDVLDRVSYEYRAESITWVDLDNAEGETGILTSTEDHSWPSIGGLNGNAYSANTAALVTKGTNSSRGSRNGRWFIAGMTEEVMAGNFLTETYIDTLQAGMDELLSRMTDTGVITDYQCFPTVVHTKNMGTPQAPNIVYVNNTQITRMTVNVQVASQRRRNRK